LGDEFKGYVFKITGGNDQQGFPMKQGVLVNGRVRLLLREGEKCFRARRDGDRSRKSIRGSVVGPDLSVISLKVVKKGEGELPGLTDKVYPLRFGPKRASKIRKLFNLTKQDDVTKYVIKKKKTKTLPDGKTVTKLVRPKIQRLLTPKVIRSRAKKIFEVRKRQAKSAAEAIAYQALLVHKYKDSKYDEKNKKVVARRKAREERVAKTGGAPEEPKPVEVKKAPAKPAAPAAEAKKAPAKPAAPAGKKGVAKPPAGEKPAKPSAKKPAGEAKAKKPAGEKPAKPAASEKPAAEKPAKPAAKESAKKEGAAKKPAAKAEAKKPAAKAEAKKPAAKK